MASVASLHRACITKLCHPVRCYSSLLRDVWHRFLYKHFFWCYVDHDHRIFLNELVGF